MKGVVTLQKKYLEYISLVLAEIKTDTQTKARIRQSLTEHIEILIEKHGSLADKYLEPAEEVAKEFSENLGLEEEKEINSRPRWAKARQYRKISQKKIFNLPLYHITDGYNPETNKFEVAKGVIAIGPVALGILALGGISFGIFSFGGAGFGLLLALGGLAASLGLACGGVALGGLIAIGGLAVSFGLALGGLAKGYIAIGDLVFGEYIYDVSSKEGNAIEWFQRYLPYFVQFFNNQ